MTYKIYLLRESSRHRPVHYSIRALQSSEHADHPYFIYFYLSVLMRPQIVFQIVEVSMS